MSQHRFVFPLSHYDTSPSAQAGKSQAAILFEPVATAHPFFGSSAPVVVKRVELAHAMESRHPTVFLNRASPEVAAEIVNASLLR